MRKLIAELRRRRVFGTSAIYLAGAWGLLEVCDTVFPIVGLPDNAITFVFYGAIVGFPIVLGLSWVFDLDLKRTSTEPTADDAPAKATMAEASVVVPLKEAPPGSIAVLPFRNIGANPEHEYFSDGLAEELLHTLSSVPGIRVAARTSCFMYKDHHTDVRTIGAQLGVSNVLEGSVRWAGDRIRISTKLIEAGSGYQLMSQKFDEEFKDVFTLQEKLANSIVEVLRQSLGDGLPAHASPVLRTDTNVEAYQFYLRGRHLWQRRGKEAIEAAVELYKQALALDPTFARAKSALAAARAVMHEYAGESRQASLAAATALAREAAALDPTLAEPHGVLGYIHLRSWQWQEAESRLLDAIERDPNDPLLRQWYSNVLNDLGQQQAATEQAAKAYELDPVSPMANNVLAVSYMLRGDDRKALKHTRIAREFGVSGLVPAFVEYLANLRGGAWDTALGDWTAALDGAGIAREWAPSVIAAIADPAAREAAVNAVARAVRQQALPPNIAFLQYVLLGAAEATFSQAHDLLDQQRLNHTWLMLPEASTLRADPRFRTLCDKIGVSKYWQRHGEPALIAGSFERARAAALTRTIGAA